MKKDDDQTLSATLHLMILIKNKPQVKTTADANQKQLKRKIFIEKTCKYEKILCKTQ